jgi:RNA polymerase sigma factor (sigma-70 family)
MPETDDIELLQQYAREGSESAFAALVARYVNMVYSAALRKTGNPHAAEEITQAVFIILARKAGRLHRRTILSGWLYQTARLTAASFLRNEIRRARREQEAYMESSSNEPEPNDWLHIAPLLEDAMGQLGDADRAAVVLRFFDKKSFQEVGAAFGASENAAKKRVARALEKLRRGLASRGVVSTSAAIASGISAYSTQAAPVGLVKSVTGLAIAKGAAAASTLTLVKGTLKMMTWIKYKMILSVSAGLLITGGAITLTLAQGDTHPTVAPNPVPMAQVQALPKPGAGNDADLSPSNILARVALAYAELSTYRDTGWTVHQYKSGAWTNTFSELLGTRTCYRVEVITAAHPFSSTNRYFSDGLGKFDQLGISSVSSGSDVIEQLNSVYSDTAIPAIYFNLSWGNIFTFFKLGPPNEVIRKPDEEIGGVDCYVVARTSAAYPVTVWVGKQDFLIRRSQYNNSLETYENIFVNETFNREDYIPKDPNGKPLR